MSPTPAETRSGARRVRCRAPSWPSVLGAVVLVALTIGTGARAGPPGTYAVTVHESGLAPGTTWVAAIGPSHLSSANSTIVFQEKPGPYLVVIAPVPRYDQNTSSIPVEVFGAPVDAYVQFTRNNSSLPPPVDIGNNPSSTQSSITPVEVALIAVAAVAVAATVYVASSRSARRRRQLAARQAEEERGPRGVRESSREGRRGRRRRGRPPNQRPSRDGTD